MSLGRGLGALFPKKDEGDERTNEHEQAPESKDSAGFSPARVTDESTGVIDVSREKKLIAGEIINTQRHSSKKFAPLPKKSQANEAIFHIEVNKIKPNPFQPRRDFDEESLKELAASIREFGVLQPLVVSKIEKESDFGTDVEYELIAGERRLRAVQMLGWERVPAIIRNISHGNERLEIAIVENLQRSNLNPVETARAYAKLQDDFGMTQREIATRLGKSRETVANTLRLLNLSAEIQQALTDGKVNESQARLILQIPSLAEQQEIFREILGKSLSVREIKSRLSRTKQKEETKNQITIDPEIKDIEERLKELLGAKVKIEQSDRGGKIIISYFSPEEIQGIIKKINPSKEESDLNDFSI